MNVVDSSAWLSYFADERHAQSYAEPISDLDHLLVPSITLIEVFKSVFRQADERSALLAVAHMNRGRVIAFDDSLALEAASCGLQFKLPLADSIIYATARKFGAVVWTQDADFKELPDVKYFAPA